MHSQWLARSTIVHSLRNIYRLTGYFPPGLVYAVALRCAERLLRMSPLLLVLLVLIAAPERLVQVFAWLLLLLFVLLYYAARSAQLKGFSACYRWLAVYRNRLLDHLCQVPIVHLRAHASAEVAEPLCADINQLETAISHQLVDFLSTLIMLLMLLLLLAAVMADFAVVMLMVLLPVLWGLNWGQAKFRRAADEKKQAFKSGAADFEDYLSGLVTLRTYGRSDWRAEGLKDHFSQLYQQAMRTELIGAIPTLTAGFAIEALLVLALFWLFSGPVYISPASLACLIILAYLLVDIAQELFVQLTMLSYGLQSEQRLARLQHLAVLAEPEPEVRVADDRSGFELIELYYSYPGSRETQLSDVSCHLPAGKTTAIVGYSGSGKTSLLNLLARFDQPTSGSIRLGGQNLEQLGSQGLYNRLSLVTQDVQLISGSIKENILLSAPDADPEWFAEVVRYSGCYCFTERFSQGLDTEVGEHGRQLSGGERQLIALARAILKQPQIILLDEATSAMDPELQAIAVQGLERLCKGKTVIVVAHRLSTIVNADQILLLDSGQLVATGNHQSLRRQSQHYRQLLSSY